MKIEKGMKCRYIGPYHDELHGKVLCVYDDYFTVYVPSDCIPQYDDSLTDFRESDIGKEIWFEGGVK